MSRVPAELAALRPRGDGTCLPYVVTRRGDLVLMTGTGWRTARWALVRFCHHQRRPVVLTKTSRTRSPGRGWVPVHRDLGPAYRALARQRRGRDQTAARDRRRRQALERLLASPVQEWRRPGFGDLDAASVRWVMTRALTRYQDGRCAICQRGEPLVVDHDHDSGLVRGALCRGCNGEEGRAESRDDPRFVAYRTCAPAGGLQWWWPG